MKKFIWLIILIFGLQFQGKSDTISNWQVYYNVELLAELNAFDRGFEIILQKENLSTGDSIFVDYFRDTPCMDCTTVLIVEDGKHHKVVENLSTGTFSQKSFSVDDLLNSEKDYFEIWYYEGTLSAKKDKQFLFRILLE